MRARKKSDDLATKVIKELIDTLNKFKKEFPGFNEPVINCEMPADLDTSIEDFSAVNKKEAILLKRNLHYPD